MKNKSGIDLGPGECPMGCNDGIACDWIGNWHDCWIYRNHFNNKVQHNKISANIKYDIAQLGNNVEVNQGLIREFNTMVAAFLDGFESELVVPPWAYVTFLDDEGNKLMETTDSVIKQ